VTQEKDPFADVDAEQGRRAEPTTEKPPPFAWLDPLLRTIGEREDGDAWFSTAPPQRDYLLHYIGDVGAGPVGVLAAGRVGFLASPGGAGKSYALCALALAVAVADRPKKTTWLGAFEVNPDKAGRVLMLMGEEEEAEIRRRLYSAAQAAELSVDDTARAIDRIVPVPLCGVDGVALTQAPASDGGTTETPFSAALRARLAKAGPWSLVVVDPLARFAGADVETDNAAATHLVQILEKLQHLPGSPTVLAAHHTRKKSGGDGPEISTDDMRGSSGLRDGARFVAVLEEQTVFAGVPNLIRFAVRKNNYGARPAFMLRRLDHGALRQATPAEQKEYADAVVEQKADKAAEKKTVDRLARDRSKQAASLNVDDVTAGDDA
jgi:RecA-family ATPase